MQPLPNTYLQTRTSFHNSHDEIDLMEIIVLLWREKLLILSIVALFLVPTFLWVTAKPSSYAVDILIDNASPYSIDSLQPSELVGGQRYQIEKLDKDLLFQKMLNQLETLPVQKTFWESWSKEPLSNDPQQANTANDIAFMQFSKNLKLTKPDPKKTTETVSKVTLITSNPTDGMELLGAYIKFLNQYIAQTTITQMEEGYKASLKQLQSDYARLANREREKLQDRLIHLTEQLELARSLNIVETPYEKLSGIELKVVDNRLYMLGTKALTEEIKALNARQKKEPSIFVDELRNMEFWQRTMEDDLEKLQTLKRQTNIFELISPPMSSFEAVSPKKLLIFLGALFLSLIAGILLVLLKQGIKNYQRRQANIPC